MLLGQGTWLLKYVQAKVGTLVVNTILRIVILPLLVVNRNSHLLRIPIVEIISAAIVFISPKILRIVDVGIVIISLPVMHTIITTPGSAKSLLGNSVLCR